MFNQSNKPNLFIVEDNRMSQLVIGACVNTHFEYQITDFDSAEDCLQKAKNIPRIILLDYGLPGINGLEAIPLLKNKWPHSQIVIISGQKDRKLITTMLRADIVDYVEKTDDVETDIKQGIEQAEKILKIKGF